MGCGASAGAPATDRASPSGQERPPGAATSSSASASTAVLGTSENPTSPKAAVGPSTPDSAPSQAQPPISVSVSGYSTSSASPSRDGAVSGASDPPPRYPTSSWVLIQGIEKKPELNGQVGFIISYDGGADRRYTVKVHDSQVRLREDKLSLAPGPPTPAGKPLDSSLAGTSSSAGTGSGPGSGPGSAGESVDAVIAALSADCGASSASTGADQAKAAEDARLREEAQRRADANEDAIRRMPQGELTSTGRLIPTYHWVQVPPVASLPPGMEVWMPVGGLKCARIPESWRLQVVAEGQVDSYRCDVGEHTLVTDVLMGAANSFGWEVHNLELREDGATIEVHDEATVGSAGLFGRKLTARNHVAA